MIVQFKKITERIAIEHGLNPKVVEAVCFVESRWDTYAVRYEPHWKWHLTIPFFAKKVSTSEATEKVLQSCSWGLMQVMGTVARELGFAEDFPRLCHPEIGIEYGCRKLKKCLLKHNNLAEALAAYNAGTPKSEAGKAYAMKVLSAIV